jgi:hypothetical protein
MPVHTIFLDCDDCLYQNNCEWCRSNSSQPPVSARAAAHSQAQRRSPAQQLQPGAAQDGVHLTGATAAKLTDSIAAYTAKLGVSKDRAYELYKTHGTCLKGLLEEGLIDKSAGVEDFLQAAHDINYDDITSDAEVPLPVPASQPERHLNTTCGLSLLACAAAPTSAERAGETDLDLHRVDSGACRPLRRCSGHCGPSVQRCGRQSAAILGPRKRLATSPALTAAGIIDTRTCELETKHSPSSFNAAMAAAGVRRAIT